MMESLEQRIVLSSGAGDLGVFVDPDQAYTPAQLAELAGTGPFVEDAIAPIEWAGGVVEAPVGSFVATFDGLFDMDRITSTIDAAGELAGFEAANVSSIGRGQWARFDVVGGLSSDEARAAVAAIDGLRGIDPNATYESNAVPNDPRYSEQWHLENTGQFINFGGEFSGFGTIGSDIDINRAWDITVGSKNTIIAVVDSGVDWDHPDLASNIWINSGEIAGNGIDDDNNGFIDDVRGWDFGDFDNNPDDNAFGAGHGTAVAGLIGASGNNGVGVAGVGWRTSILPLKHTSGAGVITLDGIVGSYDYITMMRQRGVNIVAANASYGRTVPDDVSLLENPEIEAEIVAEQFAVDAMIASGGLLIASAGNGDFLGNGIDLDGPFQTIPSQIDNPGVINVAATTPADTLTFYSNFGATSVDVAAPASATLTTTIGGGYTQFNGTSAAAPVVSGIVGLLKAVRPDLTSGEIKKILIDSSDFVPALAGKVVANGRVNAARALEIAGVSGPVVRRVTPGPITVQTRDDGTPVNSVTVAFSKPIDPAFLDTSEVQVLAAGADGAFNTGDDRNAVVTSVALEDGTNNVVRISLDTSNINLFTAGRLREGAYRVTLGSDAFRDFVGNRLNGGLVAGIAEVFDFNVVSVGDPFEANDSLGLATPVTFGLGGDADFKRLTLGDGVHGTLDVDLFRIDVPAAGLITAEVFAQRQALPSTLDAQIRLFDVNGVEIASNDQFFGSDPLVNFFVATDGVYYVGVSGFGNEAYSPTLSGSGAAQSTGSYDLRLSLDLAGPETVVRERDLSAKPATIPTDGELRDTLTFSDSRTIRDLNVTVDLDHGRVGDLRVTLISPAGAEIVLANQRGGVGDGFSNTRFDDEAAGSIENADAPFLGTFSPEQPLGNISGESGSGTWTLLIEDLVNGVGGRLHGWSLEFEMESQISGPFELNDTVASATVVSQINGAGVANLAASIGDGPFGLRDRDLYQFTATAGSTLTAFVRPTEDSDLDASLRLFDDLGREIVVASPAVGNDAVIDRFVIFNGGTYYLGVAEQNNVRYDPFNALSGAQGQSSGDYDLSITLIAGLSDVPGRLAGNDVTIGVGGNGEINALRTNGAFGVDILSSFTDTFFGVSANGAGFINGTGASGIGLPMSVVNESDAGNFRVVTEGSLRGLDIRRTISLGQDDSFAVFDVTLINRSGDTLNNVSWVEGLDPEQGLGFGLNASTSNDIFEIDTNNDGVADTRIPLVTAEVLPEFFAEPMTVAFGAPSLGEPAKGLVVTGGVPLRDADQAINAARPDPNGLIGDDRIAMAYDLGAVKQDEVINLRYFLFLDGLDADVFDDYAALESGSGGGHLASASATPATESIAGQDVPDLPYRLYYPEGFANEFIYTYLPVVNPNDEPTTVYAIARYETGERDQVLGQITIEPNARGGMTLNTPDMVNAGNALVRQGTPYAIELRSDRPVAATLSYYDTFLLDGARAAVGESFTSETSRTWTLGGVSKGDGIFNFLVFQNTADADASVSTTFYPENGGAPVTLTTTIGALRRGGWNIAGQAQILPGRYGVVIESSQPIVAALTAFDSGATTGQVGAAGALGAPGRGALSGVVPEGQIGISSDQELLGFLNANSVEADVRVTFQFESGSAFRTQLTVAPESRGAIDVAKLVNFPMGEAYSVTYTSNAPVTAIIPTYAYADGFSTSFASEARTLWGFGEGFRPAGASEQVDEYIRLYNPGATDTLVEITLLFDNGLGTETMRETVTARGVSSIDLHSLVTGEKRNVFAFYGILVRSADPIVAYMGHYDPFFPGGFGTLGTPLGASAAINLA